MIFTLLITLIAEGAVIIGYSIGFRKPVRPILLTSVWVNIVTQLFLWAVLNLFFQRYLASLFVAEIIIWMIEGILLWSIRSNQLGFNDAIVLSLGMNAASFGLGWFLPV